MGLANSPSLGLALKDIPDYGVNVDYDPMYHSAVNSTPGNSSWGFGEVDSTPSAEMGLLLIYIHHSREFFI